MLKRTPNSHIEARGEENKYPGEVTLKLFSLLLKIVAVAQIVPVLSQLFSNQQLILSYLTDWYQLQWFWFELLRYLGTALMLWGMAALFDLALAAVRELRANSRDVARLKAEAGLEEPEQKKWAPPKQRDIKKQVDEIGLYKPK